MQIEARDEHPASRSDIAFVTVIVLRNPNAPEFQRDDYEETISEYHRVGRSIITVRATDKDPANVSSIE